MAPAPHSSLGWERKLTTWMTTQDSGTEEYTVTKVPKEGTASYWSYYIERSVKSGNQWQPRRKCMVVAVRPQSPWALDSDRAASSAAQDIHPISTRTPNVTFIVIEHQNNHVSVYKKEYNSGSGILEYQQLGAYVCDRADDVEGSLLKGYAKANDDLMKSYND